LITKKRNRAGVLCYFITEQPKTESRLEYLEQIDFVNKARYIHPELEKLLIAPINEADIPVQLRVKKRAMGMLKGAGDTLIFINGANSIEMKRASKKDSSAISKDQKKFALAIESQGGIGCVAYGYLAALEALKDIYLNN